MKKTALVIVGIVNSVVITGCGLVGHVGSPPNTAPSTNQSHTSPTTSSTRPIAGTSPSSSTNTNTSDARSTATPSASDSTTHTSPGPFNPVVQQAMTFARPRTTMELQAPENVPTPQTSLYLAAIAGASQNTYHVLLQLTSTPMGLNNPNILNGAGLANDIGGFGATRYASASQADAALQNTLTPPPQAPTSTMTTPNLNFGIIGQAWPQGLVQWQEGDWTLQVTGSDTSLDTALAMHIVSYLHTHLLPETRGVMVVVNAGDGNHTQVEWQEGNVLLRTTTYHSATGAMEMAMSMRNYPSGNMPSMDANATFGTPNFAGRNVQRTTGGSVPRAIPNGYQSTISPNLTFSSNTYTPTQGFSGTLAGHPFVLDFYQDYPQGLAVGVSYDNKPVYFGYGPSPVFSVINFTGNEVVIGNPASGSYMALNLTTGQQTTNPSVINSLKGYTGLGLPSHVLGLPGTDYSSAIPYPSGQ